MWDSFADAFQMLFGPNDELRRIIAVTLQMSLCSTLISSLLGIGLGVIVGTKRFPGRGAVLRITSTLMGLPPVVAGLFVFLLLSRSGPLGELKLLYTVTAMVIAQVVLITPIILGLTASSVQAVAPKLRETAVGMGLSQRKQFLYLLYECRMQLIYVILMGFGRSIAEVGAVQMVGGNIQYKTRVMTTSIMMVTNMGHFTYAIALGVVLLLIAFVVNAFAHKVQGGGTNA